MRMRKTADQLCDYPQGPTAPDPSGGQYRLRLYEDEGAPSAPPVAVVVDAASQGPNTRWISGHGPQLASTIARLYPPAARELRLLTTYSAPDVPRGLYEHSRFGLLQNGQAVYREHFRQAGSPALQPQATIMSQSEVEALIGGPLD